MTVTNSETTGRTAICQHCGRTVEEALLLKGYRGSPGIEMWRTLDRGYGSARCAEAGSTFHVPDPASIREGEQRAGIAFGL